MGETHRQPVRIGPDGGGMEPLLIPASAASKLLGMGRTCFYAMESSGRIGPSPLRFGRKVLWSRAEIERWVECGCPPRDRWLKESK